MNRVLGVSATVAVLVGLTLDAAHAAVQWNVQAGLSMAGVRWDTPAFDPGSKLGAAFGASAQIPIGPSTFVESGLTYAMKGFSFGESEATDNSGNSLGTFETLLAVDYLEIPVLLGYSLQTQGAFRTSLYAGPYVGFEVSEKMVATGAIESITDDNRLDNTDYGLSAGARIGLQKGPGVWTLDLRYDHGMVELDDVAEDVENWAWLVLAGFSFSGPR